MNKKARVDFPHHQLEARAVCIIHRVNPNPDSSKSAVIWRYQAVLVLVALLVYVALPGFRTIEHFVLVQFCHGVSSGKVFFLLFFTGAACIRLGWSRPGAGESRIGLWLAWGAAIIGMSAGLATHLYYVLSHHLPLDQPAWHWRDGINSVSTLTHIHTSKPAIAWAVEWLGKPEWHQRFDTGWVFLDRVPQWLTLVIGGCFLTGVMAWLYILPGVVKPSAGQARISARWVAILASATICKAILDGGPLAYDAVVAIITLAYLPRLTRDDSKTRISKEDIYKGVIGFLFWIALVAWFDPGSLLSLGQRAAYRASIFLSILALPWWFTAWKQRQHVHRKQMVGAAMVFVVMLVCLARELRLELFPLLQRGPDRAVRYDGQSQPSVITNSHGLTYSGLYRREHDDPYRARRLSVRGHDDDRDSKTRQRMHRGLLAEVLPLRASDARLISTDSGLVRVLRCDLAPDSDWPRLRIQVEFDSDWGPAAYVPPGKPMDQISENERFIAYRLLDQYLREAGMSRYVLIPYAFYETPTPFQAQP